MQVVLPNTSRLYGCVDEKGAGIPGWRMVFAGMRLGWVGLNVVV